MKSIAGRSHAIEYITLRKEFIVEYAMFFHALPDKSGFGCKEKDSSYTGDWIITDEFVERWREFYAELSCRYKERVSGWWIDGFYAWSGCSNDTAPKYAKALKKDQQQRRCRFN